MTLFLSGAMFAGYLVVALYFLRSWRDTGDRLFAMFSGAFALLAVHRTWIAFAPGALEDRASSYLLRLAAFVLMLLAIVQKNRGK